MGLKSAQRITIETNYYCDKCGQIVNYKPDRDFFFEMWNAVEAAHKGTNHEYKHVCPECGEVYMLDTIYPKQRQELKFEDD